MSALRWLLLAGAMVAPVSAHAGEPVLVSDALREGELEDAGAARLEARLRDALRKSELTLIETDAANLAAARDCVDEACRATLLDAVDGHFLLVPSLRLDDQDYRLALTLYGARGQQLASLQETCSLCGLAEAEDLLADLGARIGRKVEVAARASTLAVTSEPSGARVFVGDEWVGTTPVELPLELGTHAVRIELDGYIGQQRNIDAVAGEQQRLAFALQSAAIEAPSPEPRRRPLLSALGWTSLGLGLGSALAGGVLIGIDERPITSDCSGTNVDVAGNCRWRHATLEPGIALVAGGAILLGTAIALQIVARKPGKANKPRARVLPRAGGLALHF